MLRTDNPIVYEDVQNIISRIPYRGLEGKTFLVTGATGLLCPYFVYTLMILNREKFSEPCRVMVLSRNEKKIAEKFSEFSEDAGFIPVYGSVEDVTEYPYPADYVVHAAGIAVTSMFYTHPVDVWKANALGSFNLLDYAVRSKSLGYLYFSSGSVYGKKPEGVTVLDEDMTDFSLDFSDFVNTYGQAKRVGEILARSYHSQKGLSAKSVRIGHTYGPGIDLKDERVFCDFAKRILDNEDIVIRGTGNDVRQFTYLTDAVAAFFKVLIDGEPGEAYNMANDNAAVTIAELAEILTGQAFPEKKLRVIYPEGYSPSSHPKVMLSNKKLRELGWEPQVSIAEGFQRTVKSFEVS